PSGWTCYKSGTITEIINEAKFIEQILPREQDMVIKESAIVVPLILQRLYHKTWCRFYETSSLTAGIYLIEASPSSA
ncbi:MAG: hypothetical protein WCJ54_07070, partial [Actinomycetota bacterium]